jgi:hypothetical protein
MARITTSMLPPGGNGTTMVIGRVGKSCARGATDEPARMPMNANAAMMRCCLFIKSSRRGS